MPTDEQFRQMGRTDTDRQVAIAREIVDRVNVYGREPNMLRYGNEDRLIVEIAKALAYEMRHGAIEQRRALEMVPSR